MPLQQINPGSPPLLWSNVQEAFTSINANFETLSASIGGGGSLIDWEQFDNSIIPTTSNIEVLGSITNRWKAVHVDTYRDTLTDTLNGVWLGPAQIKGVGNSVDLPAGSTVDGNLIIDLEKTFFKRISVDDFNVIEANEFSDTINLTAGTAMQLVVDSSAERITLNNIGVTRLAGGTAISVSSATGNITVTNTGVTSLTNSTSLPSGLAAGSGISVSSANGAVLITNTGVLQVQQGFGITVSTDAASGISTISNSAPAQVTFRNVVINGDNLNPIVADSTSDTLNIDTGYGLITTKNVATDTFSIALNQRIDIIGSVFGDDSTKIVDAVENKVYGGIFATTLRTAETRIALGAGAGVTNQGLQTVAVGESAGSVNQGNRTVSIGSQAGQYRQSAYSVAIGPSSGFYEQGDSAVAIGDNAGQSSQGDYAIAVGHYAGHNNQSANSIILNASGAILNGAAAGFYVNPVRNATGANGVLQYDSTTKEVSYSSAVGSISGTFTGNIFTNLIDSADSSEITVTPKTIFSSDIQAENDINVAERLTVKGSRVINLDELKAIVAGSADFTELKTAIAALV